MQFLRYSDRNSTCLASTWGSTTAGPHRHGLLLSNQQELVRPVAGSVWVELVVLHCSDLSDFLWKRVA